MSSLRTFDFLQIALKYGYMIQRLVRSIRPKIACAEADIVSWLHLSLHVVSGCVGKRGWCRGVHDRARLSANVSGYPNVTGNTLVLDAHCLADCKGLGSKGSRPGPNGPDNGNSPSTSDSSSSRVAIPFSISNVAIAVRWRSK